MSVYSALFLINFRTLVIHNQVLMPYVKCLVYVSIFVINVGIMLLDERIENVSEDYKLRYYILGNLLAVLVLGIVKYLMVTLSRKKSYIDFLVSPYGILILLLPLMAYINPTFLWLQPTNLLDKESKYRSFKDILVYGYWIVGGSLVLLYLLWEAIRVVMLKRGEVKCVSESWNDEFSEQVLNGNAERKKRNSGKKKKKRV